VDREGVRGRCGVTLDVMVDAEIVEPLDKKSVEQLDRRIRLLVGTIHDQMVKLSELVTEAKRGNLHEALGFPSWTAYLADVFTVEVRLDGEQRRELVAYLSGEGMSQRAIADVVGVDRKTVRKDLAEQVGETGPPAPVTGLDGKTYSPKPKRDKREAETEIEAREELPRHDLDDDDDEIDEEAKIVDAIECVEMYAEDVAESAKEVVAYGKVPDDAVKSTFILSRGCSMKMVAERAQHTAQRHPRPRTPCPRE
jgi:transposase